MQYVIRLWYRKDELAKRSCIFHTSNAIDIMISGYLMTAVYHLGGRGGLVGWQRQFIIDGVISLPIALAGFFVLPDVPEICRVPYLTQKVKEIESGLLLLWDDNTGEGFRKLPSHRDVWCWKVAHRGPLTPKPSSKRYSPWYLFVIQLREREKGRRKIPTSRAPEAAGLRHRLSPAPPAELCYSASSTTPASLLEPCSPRPTPPNGPS
jgi:hypothetical protein